MNAHRDSGVLIDGPSGRLCLHRGRLGLRRRRVAAPPLRHPRVDIAQVTSESHAGEFVHSLHPNLRPAGEAPASHAASRSASPPSPSCSRATCSSSPCRTARPSAASRTSRAWRGTSSTSPRTSSARPRPLSRHVRGSSGRWGRAPQAGVQRALRLRAAGDQPGGHPRRRVRQRRRLQRHGRDPRPVAPGACGPADRRHACRGGREGGLLRGGATAAPRRITRSVRARCAPSRPPATATRRRCARRWAARTFTCPSPRLSWCAASWPPRMRGSDRAQTTGALACLPRGLRRRAIRPHRTRAQGHLPPPRAEAARRDQPGRCRLGSPRPADAWWRSPRSTTWARARQARGPVHEPHARLGRNPRTPVHSLHP